MYCTTDSSFPISPESPSYPPSPSPLVSYKVSPSSAVLLSQQLACLSLFPSPPHPQGVLGWLKERGSMDKDARLRGG